MATIAEINEKITNATDSELEEISLEIEMDIWKSLTPEAKARLENLLFERAMGEGEQ